MPDENLRAAVLDEIEDAGAVAGSRTHLLTADLAERLDADRDELEDVLETLRFDEREVVKGPKHATGGSEWRLRNPDAVGLE